MKKAIYLLCTLLLVASTYLVSPAKAQTPPCYDADPTTGSCPVNPGGGANLPINSGVIYLLAAGFIVGMVAIKKHKPALIKA